MSERLEHHPTNNSFVVISAVCVEADLRQESTSSPGLNVAVPSLPTTTPLA
jgi:hypothetical protein